MKHSQFESWILDDRTLSSDQRQKLETHLGTCTRCKKLSYAWQFTKQIIRDSNIQFPKSGFNDRWESILILKSEHQHTRHVRNTLLLLVFIAGLGSLLYILSNNLILDWFTSGLNTIIQFFVLLTKGLSNINHILFQVPSVTISAVIMTFGIVVAFLTVAVFTTWRMLSKELPNNEIINKN